MIKQISALLLLTFTYSIANAQSSFEDFKQRIDSEFHYFKSTRDKEFDEFRRKINDEYAAMIEKAWAGLNAIKGIPEPREDRPVPPIIYDEDATEPIKNESKPYDEVIPIISPEPQPEPIVPIEYEQEPIILSKTFTFQFFDTEMTVRVDDAMRITIGNCEETSVAETWQHLSATSYANTVNDCLKLRSSYHLCDWAYLSMLQEFCKSWFGTWSNEASVLAAFLYCQSGYQMRLAMADNRIYLLYSSKHTIYGTSYWDVDGEKFYALGNAPSQIFICQATFPEERPLSLQITTEQMLAMHKSSNRILQSQQFEDVSATVNTNENLIAFFDSYPSSMFGDNFMTRWAIYANTPLSREAKSTLYPSLIQSIDGKTELDAVSRLLNFVQTAFVYEYDDKIWGADRAFFPDETLYYPYCDCEDRSILFSRLVRDLLKLNVVLVYYPGHLATAVNFTDDINGDHIVIDGKNYTICDPTYIGAPVGATMPNMDNSMAKVILLE